MQCIEDKTREEYEEGNIFHCVIPQEECYADVRRPPKAKSR